MNKYISILGIMSTLYCTYLVFPIIFKALKSIELFWYDKFSITKSMLHIKYFWLAIKILLYSLVLINIYILELLLISFIDVSTNVSIIISWLLTIYVFIADIVCLVIFLLEENKKNQIKHIKLIYARLVLTQGIPLVLCVLLIICQ